MLSTHTVVFRFLGHSPLCMELHSGVLHAHVSFIHGSCIACLIPGSSASVVLQAHGPLLSCRKLCPLFVARCERGGRMLRERKGREKKKEEEEEKGEEDAFFDLRPPMGAWRPNACASSGSQLSCRKLCPFADRVRVETGVRVRCFGVPNLTITCHRAQRG